MQFKDEIKANIETFFILALFHFQKLLIYIYLILDT